ncbi:MAG: hypothetical protein KC419_24870 [Anaerolineales bacterium]|nr:hypothetical protein [Anaerolineales bacterium]
MSDTNRSQTPLRIALVGPCASGKSTLARSLKAAGYVVRQPAQEHSFAPDMWQRMSKPDVLIFLDVDYLHFQQRRPKSDGGPAYFAEQHRRLAHARKHCDFYLDTSPLSKGEVETAVYRFLQDNLS